MSVVRRIAADAAGGWERFWFREGSLFDLAVARIALTGFVLYLDAGGRFVRVATVDADHWMPIALVQTLGLAQPGSEQLAWLGVATRTVLFSACLGALTNVSLAVALGLQLLQEGYLNCLGKVTHATLPMLYALLFLALSPCGQRLSIDAAVRRWRARRSDAGAAPAQDFSRNAAWPFDLLFVELAAFYFQAGSAKLMASGPAWADGYSLQFYLLQAQQPAGLWLAGHLWLCSALSVAVLLLELAFPLAIVVRRLRPCFLAGGFLFHLGTRVFMNISFWPVWVLYLLFVPWGRVAGARPRLRFLPGREATA